MYEIENDILFFEEEDKEFSKIDKFFISFESALDEYNKNVSLLNYLKYKDEYNLSNDSLDLLYIISGIENFNIRNLKKELEIATEGFLEAIGNFFKAIWNFIKRLFGFGESSSDNISETEKQNKETKETMKETDKKMEEMEKELYKKFEERLAENRREREEEEERRKKEREQINNLKEGAAKTQELIERNKREEEERNKKVEETKRKNEERLAKIKEKRDNLTPEQKKKAKDIMDFSFLYKQCLNTFKEKMSNMYTSKVYLLDGETLSILSRYAEVSEKIFEYQKTLYTATNAEEIDKLDDKYNSVNPDEVVGYDQRKKLDDQKKPLSYFLLNPHEINKYKSLVNSKLMPILKKINSIYREISNYFTNIIKKNDISDDDKNTFTNIKNNTRQIMGLITGIMKGYHNIDKSYKWLSNKVKQMFNMEFKELYGIYPKNFLMLMQKVN